MARMDVGGGGSSTKASKSKLPPKPKTINGTVKKKSSTSSKPKADGLKGFKAIAKVLNTSASDLVKKASAKSPAKKSSAPTAYDKTKAIANYGKTKPATTSSTTNKSTSSTVAKKPSTSSKSTSKSSSKVSSTSKATVSKKSSGSSAPSWQSSFSKSNTKEGYAGGISKGKTRLVYNGKVIDTDNQSLIKQALAGGAKKASTPSNTGKAPAKGGTPVKAPASTGSKSNSSSSLDAQKKAIQNALKANSNAYYANQKAGFDKLKQNSLSDIERAWIENQQQATTDQRFAQEAYDDQRSDINTSAYQQAQATNLMAYDMGIQNSQQMLGLQAGDNTRKNNAVEGAMTERDRSIATIKERLARVLEQKGLDTTRVNSDYGYNLNSARGQADMMYNEGLNQFQMGNYDRDAGFLNQQALQNSGFAHDTNMANLDQKNKLALMAQENAYQQALARLGGGGGGGGGSTKSSASASTKAPANAVNALTPAYNAFKTAKNTSAISAYNNSYAVPKPATQSVVRNHNPYPLGAPPTVANNPNMSAWQKMQMFQGKAYN